MSQKVARLSHSQNPMNKFIVGTRIFFKKNWLSKGSGIVTSLTEHGCFVTVDADYSDFRKGQTLLILKDHDQTDYSPWWYVP